MLYLQSLSEIIESLAHSMEKNENLQFETRSNVQGKNTNTVSDTQLHDWVSVAGGFSVDRDFYQNGYINTTTVVGTGVEKVWLRIKSQSQATGFYDYIVRYTIS